MPTNIPFSRVARTSFQKNAYFVAGPWKGYDFGSFIALTENSFSSPDALNNRWERGGISDLGLNFRGINYESHRTMMFMAHSWYHRRVNDTYLNEYLTRGNASLVIFEVPTVLGTRHTIWDVFFHFRAAFLQLQGRTNYRIIIQLTNHNFILERGYHTIVTPEMIRPIAIALNAYAVVETGLYHHQESGRYQYANVEVFKQLCLEACFLPPCNTEILAQKALRDSFKQWRINSLSLSQRWLKTEKDALDDYFKTDSYPDSCKGILTKHKVALLENHRPMPPNSVQLHYIKVNGEHEHIDRTRTELVNEWARFWHNQNPQAPFTPMLRQEYDLLEQPRAAQPVTPVTAPRPVNNATPPRQPVQNATPPQQPVQNATPPQQPVQNATPPQQPVQNATPPQQPVQNATPPRQPVQPVAQQAASHVSEEPLRPHCVICLVAPRACGFLHNGTVHNVACKTCADLIMGSTKQCPLCRQPVSQVVTVFNA